MECSRGVNEGNPNPDRYTHRVPRNGEKKSRGEKRTLCHTRYFRIAEKVGEFLTGQKKDEDTKQNSRVVQANTTPKKTNLTVSPGSSGNKRGVKVKRTCLANVCGCVR